MKKSNEKKLDLKTRHSHRSSRDQHTAKKRNDDSILLEGKKGRNIPKQKYTALKLIAETETPAGCGGAGQLPWEGGSSPGVQG